MKTLILYASRFGTAKECAERIAQKLGNKADVKSAAQAVSLSLEHYDRVIIGGSVYAGTMDRGYKQYLDQKTGELLQKKIGLFLCGTAVSEKMVQESIAANFPPKLLKASLVTSHFGGRIAFTKMKGISKFFLGIALKKQLGKKVSTKVDYDGLDLAKVDKFARDFDRATKKGGKHEEA